MITPPIERVEMVQYVTPNGQVITGIPVGRNQTQLQQPYIIEGLPASSNQNQPIYTQGTYVIPVNQQQQQIYQPLTQPISIQQNNVMPVNQQPIYQPVSQPIGIEQGTYVIPVNQQPINQNQQQPVYQQGTYVVNMNTQQIPPLYQSPPSDGSIVLLPPPSNNPN